jgi:phytoene dehydrogenase-like protein
VTAETDRLVFLLQVLEKEGHHLLGTTARLFAKALDAAWVQGLDERPELAERLDAFVARFGRMQDTIGDKLIPELRRQLLETPGAALDNLNRMEKLGLLASVVDWVEARALRNRLVHEYLQDAAEFAAALNRARELVPLLVHTYNLLNAYIQARFAATTGSWPQPLEEPDS